MADTAAAQLRRILSVIPELADDREHRIEEVAERVGVDRSTLLKDLESLATRYDAPGGFVEGIQLFFTSDTVSVMSNHFLRPMRLTVGELRALELGLAMLRTELPPDERGAVDSARERLLAAIAKLPGDDEINRSYHVEQVPVHNHDVLGILRKAYRSREKVRLRYHKAEDDRESERVICPYAFVVAAGQWYVVALCESAAGMRVFRADRIAGAAPASEKYEIPPSFSVSESLAKNKAFESGSAGGMKVKYSPRIARWIAEREEGETGADGYFTVTHPLVDFGWGVRHVLQYGPDAEVLEPPHLRAAIAEKLRAILAQT